RHQQSQLKLARAVFFDRYSLEIARQKTFDDSGGIISETRYSDWKDFEGVRFPSAISIRRPKDGYELAITIVSAKFNQPDMTAQRFVLEQPPGAKVMEIR